MHILIAADMEGISGVADWQQVTPGTADYERFRRVMTQDVNAAVEGALAGGASEVAVTDGHGGNLNIVFEDLHPATSLNTGGPSPLSMVQGAENADAVFFLGYHAMAGTANAILDHTWSSEKVIGVWLNGREAGEIALNAAVCGHFGVPVVMVSGDQTACAEARDFLGNIETAMVKEAFGQSAARCLPAGEARARIRGAAQRAVVRLGQGTVPAPFRPDLPVEVAVQFARSVMADRAALMPGATRDSGTCVSYRAADPIEMYRAFRTMVTAA